MFKVLILKNKASVPIEDEIPKVLQYFFSRVPFQFSFEFKDVDVPLGIKPYKTFQGFNTTTGQPSLETYYGLVDGVKSYCQTLVAPNTYDCVIFAYNFDGIPLPSDGVITSFTHSLPLYTGTQFIQLALNQYLKEQNKIPLIIQHELMHSFCFILTQQGISVIDEMDLTILSDKRVIPFYKNDEPESLDGNFANTFENIKPYLDKLVKQQYQYFSQAELDKWKLKPELFTLLDKARGIAGVPFNITSGLRTISQNSAVGGVDGSEHILGLGVDILADTSEKRFKIVSGALQAGFTRIGVYNNHIHLGLGKLPSFTEGVIWVISKD